MWREVSLLILLTSITSAQFLDVTLEPPQSEGGEVNTHHLAQPYSFSEADSEHKRLCSRHRTCLTERRSLKSTCCGSCSCEIDCGKYGSCCLENLINFANARIVIASSRYGCVSTQYLPFEDTDYSTDLAFWLVSKCDRGYKDREEINKCHNPDPDLESFVPVTESTTNYRHFKNKHCAYCNFVDKRTPLIYWKVKIQDSHLLTFPTSNLLQQLKRTRGNIFFIIPEYLHISVSAYGCKFAPENLVIGKCNVTGLWAEYNPVIQKACESYNDIFNYTYRNVFCFMCNERMENIQNWIKEDVPCTERIVVVQKPQFSATLDVKFVKEGHSENHIMCEDAEVQDFYLKVCRRIYCDDGGYLLNGVCRWDTISQSLNGTCFTVFLKFVPVINTLKVSDVDKLGFSASINNDGVRNIVNKHTRNYASRTLETDVFFQTNENDFIDYVVAYIIIEFDTRVEKSGVLDDIVQRPRVLLNCFRESVFEFDLEPALYNMTIVNGRREVQVHTSISGVQFDKLVSGYKYVPNYSHNCSNEQTVLMTKLHACPFIKLRADEIEYDVRNGFLLLGMELTEKPPIKVLSTWEYEIHENFIFICLEDFFDLQTGLVLSETVLSDKGSVLSCYSWHIDIEVLLNVYLLYLQI